MALRGIVPALIANFCLSPLAAAQAAFPSPSRIAPQSTVGHAGDFSDVVVPITSLKVGIQEKPRGDFKPSLNPLSYIDLGEALSSKYGTGFCVDPACRFIGTNYHVAVASFPRKINGEKVIQQYLATGPDDVGATVNEGLSLAKYNLSRDLAIFELGRPLPHHHGVGYNLDGLDDGQEVEIYAYPKESDNPISRRGLQLFHARFKGETPTGLLAFDCTSGETIRAGASGGIVVDKKTQQVVGILSGVARSDKTIALAVPVQSLAEFVSKVQPYLAERLFRSYKTISPVSADLYPRFVTSPAEVLQHRPQEPAEVKTFRSKAQLLADSMRNFIAVQTLAWGSGNKEPAAEASYEVQVIDGYQRFREYPEGKKQLENVPFPPLSNAIVPGAEWSDLPQFLGTKLGLNIREMPDATVNEREIKVFQYQAALEDGLCKWDIGVDYGFFARSKILDAAVYGEVWTDEDNNILRISEHCEPPETFKWKDYATVITYGWIKRADEPPRLIPVSIYTQAEHKKRIYWCRGQFTNYRIFDSSVKVIANGAKR